MSLVLLIVSPFAGGVLAWLFARWGAAPPVSTSAAAATTVLPASLESGAASDGRVAEGDVR